MSYQVGFSDFYSSRFNIVHYYRKNKTIPIQKLLVILDIINNS